MLYATVISYDNLALLYTSLKKYDKAIYIYEQIINIKKQIFGNNHHELITPYTELSDIYKNIEEYTKASLFLKKACSILDKKL